MSRRSFGWVPPNHTCGPLRWVPTDEDELPPGAVEAGTDLDGNLIYVGRSYHNGGTIPAKVCPTQGTALVPSGGGEITVLHYEVLVSEHVRWRKTKRREIPSDAVRAGRTRNGDILFIGRTMHDGVLIPGVLRIIIGAVTEGHYVIEFIERISDFQRHVLWNLQPYSLYYTTIYEQLQHSRRKVLLTVTDSWKEYLDCICHLLAESDLVASKVVSNAFTEPFKEILLPSSQIIHTAQRSRYTTPINTVIMFVPQQEAWIVERMGKFHRILDPGFNLLVPFVDSVKYVQSLKEIAIDIPKQSAITADNVTLNIDGVLYLRILDPYKASYGVEDPEFAITQLAQTTMRSELGKISLDKVFRERESLNVGIVESINKASEAWGITSLRYEIRDIKLPPRVQEAMQMQVEAERKKRAAILESEGAREADINVAEGQRQARILASEAERLEQINKASGEAEALLAIAEARAKGITIIARALHQKEGAQAASLRIAEQYIDAFNQLAQKSNTLILPSNVGDIPSAVTQAMAIYQTVSQRSLPTNINSFTNQSSALNCEDPEYYSDKEDGKPSK